MNSVFCWKPKLMVVTEVKRDGVHRRMPCLSLRGSLVNSFQTMVWTSGSISITWELIRNVNSQDMLQTHRSKTSGLSICVLTAHGVTLLHALVRELLV